MSLIKEFKDFAMKGNVVDMAVGIIIGGAFGKIVSSLVNDVIMPPIGMLVGGVNFSDLSFPLGTGSETVLADGTKEAGKQVFLNYGMFIQTVFDFLIVAAAVFAMIKIMNTARFQVKVKFNSIYFYPSILFKTQSSTISSFLQF